MKNFENIFNNEKRNDARESDFKKRKPEKRDFGSRGGGRDRGRDGGRDRQMYEATCSECGKRCELPFKPSGDKPVYCSQCFSNHGGGSDFSRPERRGGDRPRFRDKPMFDAVCDRCGKRFELPFRPSGDRPVYCSQCFEKGGNGPSNVSKDNSKEQFDALNAKLDRIIRTLEVMTVREMKEVKEEVKKVEVAPKAKEKVIAKVVAKKVAAKKVVKKKKAKK